MAERPALRVGDNLRGQPCNVQVTVRICRVAYGFCFTCQRSHVLDAAAYDAGRGPWRRIGRWHGGAYMADDRPTDGR